MTAIRMLHEGETRLIQLIARKLRNLYGSQLLDRDGKQLDDKMFGLIAETAMEAVPAQVFIGCGGCGGEPVVASFTDRGEDAVIRRVCEEFDVEDDPEWPVTYQIPLLKR